MILKIQAYRKQKKSFDFLLSDFNAIKRFVLELLIIAKENHEEVVILTNSSDSIVYQVIRFGLIDYVIHHNIPYKIFIKGADVNSIDSELIQILKKKDVAYLPFKGSSGKIQDLFLIGNCRYLYQINNQTIANFNDKIHALRLQNIMKKMIKNFL